MVSTDDRTIASVAFGFTIGFGFLTVWEAFKQTRRNRNPRRSMYIYMIWGEVVANIAFAVMAFLLLDGTLPASIPVYFFILFFWVFQIQLLMQIIINRIAIIAERQDSIRRLKYGVAVIITMINIAVFSIFIPAHVQPPVSQTYVDVNDYWDRTSKFLIMFVDAGLNSYFLMVVRKRLLKQAGLTKYKPLVDFNAKLMVLSVAMDCMLIGLMWLPNQNVFLCFHPVTYTVKLNIEMSMASLILRLARSGAIHEELADGYSKSNSHSRSGNRRERWSRRITRDQKRADGAMPLSPPPGMGGVGVDDFAMKSFNRTRIETTTPGEELDEYENLQQHQQNGHRPLQHQTSGGITKQMDIQITRDDSDSEPEHHHEHAGSTHHQRTGSSNLSGSLEGLGDLDDVALARHPGPPRSAYKHQDMGAPRRGSAVGMVF